MHPYLPRLTIPSFIYLRIYSLLFPSLYSEILLYYFRTEKWLVPLSILDAVGFREKLPIYLCTTCLYLDHTCFIHLGIDTLPLPWSYFPRIFIYKSISSIIFPMCLSNALFPSIIALVFLILFYFYHTAVFMFHKSFISTKTVPSLFVYISCKQNLCLLYNGSHSDISI